MNKKYMFSFYCKRRTGKRDRLGFDDYVEFNGSIHIINSENSVIAGQVAAEMFYYMGYYDIELKCYDIKSIETSSDSLFPENFEIPVYFYIEQALRNPPKYLRD